MMRQQPPAWRGKRGELIHWQKNILLGADDEQLPTGQGPLQYVVPPWHPYIATETLRREGYVGLAIVAKYPGWSGADLAEWYAQHPIRHLERLAIEARRDRDEHA